MFGASLDPSGSECLSVVDAVSRLLGWGGAADDLISSKFRLAVWCVDAIALVSSAIASALSTTRAQFAFTARLDNLHLLAFVNTLGLVHDEPHECTVKDTSEARVLESK